jgi:hypothetical protein
MVHVLDLQLMDTNTQETALEYNAISSYSYMLCWTEVSTLSNLLC